MAADSKIPEGTRYPLVPTQEDRPRWWFLLVILVVAVVPAVAVVVAANQGDDRVPGPIEELWGMRWEVALVEGAEAPEVPTDGSLTVEFDTERQVRFTGCNGGSGSVTVANERLRGEEMMSTEMGCLGAEGEVLMDWDRWFARLLVDGVEVERTDGSIILRGDAGSVELSAAGPVEEREPAEDPDASVSREAPSSSPDGTTTVQETEERPGR